jgi:hypothetical protein
MDMPRDGVTSLGTHHIRQTVGGSPCGQYVAPLLLLQLFLPRHLFFHRGQPKVLQPGGLLCDGNDLFSGAEGGGGGGGEGRAEHECAPGVQGGEGGRRFEREIETHQR